VNQPITLAEPVPVTVTVSVTLFSGGAFTTISVVYESAPADARSPVTLIRAIAPAAGDTLVPAVETTTVDVPAIAEDAATARLPLKITPAGIVMRVPVAVTLPARI
jgi:hypothetical protein